MMKTSAKIEVQLLVDACKRIGITHVVLSPGSRNAPLSIAFDEDPFFTNILIPDERSAAFVAMGMAQQLKKPVLIACTSGSAPLNYYPAVVEAFYQQIPLLIVTADRPAQWTDQGDGQTIRQQHVFGSHVNDFAQLNEIHSDEDRWFFERNLARTLFSSNGKMKGPVHLNMPFSEPLYETTEATAQLKSWIEPLEIDTQISTNGKVKLKNLLTEKQRKLIIIGQNSDATISLNSLNEIAKRKDTVVLSEHTSNVPPSNCIDRIDQVLNLFDAESENIFFPDVIIQLGDAIISKKIKRFLRRSNAPVIRVNHAFPEMDVFQNLKYSLQTDNTIFLDFLNSEIEISDVNFVRIWTAMKTKVQQKHNEVYSTIPYSDLKVVGTLLDSLEKNTQIHVSNSSMIRYALLFENKKNFTYYCNRGTSGIDGSTSTALGAALANPSQKHLMLTGDLSFLYDSNALWNAYFPENLRIVIVNNGGGDIFNIISGPDSTQQHKTIFVAEQQFKMKNLVANFNLSYREVNSIELFEKALLEKEIQVIEVNTMHIENANLLKKYFQLMK